MARKLENWLQAYGKYTAGTESPESYHVWVGIATILAAAQRKIKFELGRLNVHSNLLLVLVGPAGFVRKTVALDIGRSLIDDHNGAICLKDYGIEIELAPEKCTGAAFIRRMTRIRNPIHQSITAFVGELGTLLGGKESDVINTIVNFWDCRADFVSETIARDIEKIKAPWVHLIGATTPVWLAENLSNTAMEGGFVSRGLFVYEAEAREAVPVPRLTDEQRNLRLALVHDLAEIARLEGSFGFTEAGDRWWDSWYRKVHAERPADPRFATQHARRPINTLKVAMALSLAEKDELLIDEELLEQAAFLVDSLIPGMPLAFQGVGRNELAMDYERIKKQIQLAGRIHYRHLIATNINFLDKGQIDAILMTLVQAEEIGREGQNFFHRAA